MTTSSGSNRGVATSAGVGIPEARWKGSTIVEALGVVLSAGSTWLRRIREGGVAALRTQRHHTRKRAKLTNEQPQQLLKLLQLGAEAQEEIGARWTGKRAAALVKREFRMVLPR